MSDKYPIKVSELKINHYLIIKDRPCKLIDMSISKTGKHGHAKAHIVALDIFNGNKYEIIESTSKEIWIPEVKRFTYTLVDIDQDGYISLISDENETREDLNFNSSLVPAYFSDPTFTKTEIEERLDEDDVIVVTLRALGIEMITEFK